MGFGAGIRHGFERGQNYPSPRDEFRYRNDFTIPTEGSLQASGTGANTISPAGVPQGSPGIYQASVAAVADRATWAWESAQLRQLLVGGGRIQFEGRGYMTTLSNGVDNTSFQMGLGDSLVAADHVDAVCLECDLTTNGNGNWFLVTASNSVRTRTDLGVAPTAATFQRLGLDINPDGSQVIAKIDDVVRATVATNIPKSAGRQLTLFSRTVKQLGAGAMTTWVDYVDLLQTFSTRR